MQKKLIALALAGLVSAPVFAQSNVTIYGRADYGYMSRSGDNGAVADVERKGEMDAGLQGGSRIGFRGAEDLGNGLKAIFQFEFGSVNMDIASGGLGSSRNAYVGLTGAFGTLIGGRLDGVRYGIFGKHDPFANGNVANFTQMTSQVDRADNAIAYVSPNFSGLTATLAYSTQVKGDEAAGNDGDGILTTAMLAYDNGPFSANLDAERIRYNANGGDTEAVRVYTVASSYDFGVVKLGALYDIFRAEGRNGDGDADVRSWFVSAKAPVGNFVLKAIYGRTEDKDSVNTDEATKWGIGGDYNLSKRTNLYATYGSIRNKGDSAIELSPAGSGYHHSAAYGVRGFDLGIAHKF